MRMMQILFFLISVVNISNSAYCSQDYAKNNNLDTAKVSDCSECGTNYCEGASSTCLISPNGACVDDPKRSLFNRGTLQSEKRPDACSDIDEQFDHSPGRNSNQAYQDDAITFLVDGFVGATFEGASNFLEDKKNQKLMGQIIGTAGAFAGPFGGLASSMLLETFMDDPMKQQVDFLENAVDCNRHAITQLKNDVKTLKEGVQYLRDQIDAVWIEINNNRDAINDLERRLEVFTLTQMTVQNIEHMMDFQLVVEEMSFEIMVLKECLQHPSHGNCKNEDLSPIGGARFTRVYEHGMAVNNIIATWFEVATQYQPGLLDFDDLDLDWNGKNVLDELVARTNVHALSALLEYGTELTAFLTVYEFRGGYNVWETSAGPFGALTMLKEMCGVIEHLQKAKSFFEEFKILSYYYAVTDAIHNECEYLENTWKSVRATHQFFLTARDNDKANHFFGRTDCSDDSSSDYKWPPEALKLANIPLYNFGYRFGTDEVNFMASMPGKFDAKDDICGASKTEWVAIHESDRSEQKKADLIEQSCNYQRFFACLEFVKFNFGYIEKGDFKGFEYQSWETRTITDTNEKVYLRQNQLREFMVEPRCAHINVVTNWFGHNAEKHQNKFSLVVNFKINGELQSFDCAEDVKSIDYKKYPVRACGCIPSGAIVDLTCEAVHDPEDGDPKPQQHGGYEQIGFHIEMNGEKFCLSNSDNNAEYNAEYVVTEDNHWINGMELAEHKQIQVKSLHEEKYLESRTLNEYPIDPWCWKKWEDVNFKDFGVPTGPGACFEASTETDSSAASVPAYFALIDGAPGNGLLEEVTNPDPTAQLGEVQCCRTDGTCTRRDPWNSNDNNACLSGNNDASKYSLQEAANMCANLGESWSLCTRQQVDNDNCRGKGCHIDHAYTWVIDDEIWDENCYADETFTLIVDSQCIADSPSSTNVGTWYRMPAEWHSNPCDDSTCVYRCRENGIAFNSDYGPTFGDGDTVDCYRTHRLAASVPADFALIDGAPASGDYLAEITNPDPTAKLGEVQCCRTDGTCTRRDPWNSPSNDHCMSGNNDASKYTFQEAANMCADLGENWSLCTRQQVDNGNCQGKGCHIDMAYTWVINNESGRRSLDQRGWRLLDPK